MDDQETDITSLLETAMAAGDLVELRGGNWSVSRKITFAPGAAIVGVHRPVIRLAGHIANAAFVLSAGCRISGLIVDADKGSKPYHYSYVADLNGDHNVIEDVDVIDPLSEAFRVFGSHNRLSRGRIADGNRSAIFLRGGTDVTIEDFLFENMAHFGVHADQGANRGLLRNLRTTKSGLELIALLQDTWGFRVEGNHAEGTGDNGISIGGWGHIVVGNVTRRNAHNGICLFGSGNTCLGNVVEGNNQRVRTEPWPTFAGISATPNFGSLGRQNAITGNWSGDDQIDPTQWAGLQTKRNSHIPWTAGATVKGSNPFRSHGGRVYKAVVAQPTVCGSIPPTHTSGLWSDGAVAWNYVAGDGSTLDAYGNLVVGNVAPGNTGYAFRNDSSVAQEAGGQL